MERSLFGRPSEQASAQNKAHQIESKRVCPLLGALSLFSHSRSQVDSAKSVRKLFTTHSIINKNLIPVVYQDL
jgi:hypothetical protein